MQQDQQQDQDRPRWRRGPHRLSHDEIRSAAQRWARVLEALGTE